ncbi:hypothetical protein HYV88_01300 [Candidatus Woesearchaeota archaeon]|nr:hypothetical protein [Candidatus Woesearchaeota archaeon]
METAKESLGLFDKAYLKALNFVLDYGGFAASFISGVGYEIQNSSLFASGAVTSMASPVIDNLFISGKAANTFRSSSNREIADYALDQYTNGQLVRNIFALFVPQQAINTYNEPTSTNILATAGLVGLTVLSHIFSRTSKKKLTEIVEYERE